MIKNSSTEQMNASTSLHKKQNKKNLNDDVSYTTGSKWTPSLALSRTEAPEDRDSQCPPRLARNETKYLQISKQVITKPPGVTPHTC